MLKVSAKDYIELGENIVDSRCTYELDDYFHKDQFGEKKLNLEGKKTLVADLFKWLEICTKLSLSVSAELIGSRIKKPPETVGEFDVLVDAVKAELKNKLFLFVPSHLAKYYDVYGSLQRGAAFPLATRELHSAGTCLAAGMYTASVFHSMRAAEIGVKAMATELGVKFSFPIELAEFGQVIGEIEPKINELKKPPRDAKKDADLKFYSEAASQFRHFNNGWRIRVAHARETYDEPQAITVYEHTVSFFETLATRLKEPRP